MMRVAWPAARVRRGVCPAVTSSMTVSTACPSGRSAQRTAKPSIRLVPNQNSIAAVAIGGTSLFGGSGGIIGSIFGALILRTISDLLFVFNAPALWQPLFQGFILLGAVCLGALRVLRRKNQMDVFQ